MAVRAALLCTALLTALALTSSETAAAPGAKVGVTDDAWLEFGPGTLDERIARLRELGVEVVRVTIQWRQVEAKQGTFDWARPDALLEALRAADIEPVVALWATPSWANGGRGANVAPRSGSTFATFARAAAERYPWIRRWIVWNEPNQRRWLLPPSPVVYVTKLLNPAGAAIKSVIPNAAVAGGATAPRGGRGGTSPVAFIRGMGRVGARLDAYAHHPYALSPAETPSSGACDRCETITLASIDRLLRETRTAFGPRTRIWLTEIGYQTNPPDRILGVSWAKQARFVAEAQRRSFAAARVDLVIQYLFRDEPSLGAWQSGLETATGRVKPALASFSLPLVQLARRGSSTVVWGQIRPGTGARPYVLERRVGTAWEPIGGALQTSSRGTFTRTIQAEAGTRIRLYDPSTDRASPALVVT